MYEADQTLGGARWISVEPKGTMAKLGDFLANMGFDTPGKQWFALAGLALLFIAMVWVMSRPTQPKLARGGRIVRSGDSLPSGKRGAAAAMTPLPVLTRSVAERGATIPLRPAAASVKPQPWIGLSRRGNPADATPPLANRG
jgi:hypothetical protein